MSLLVRKSESAQSFDGDDTIPSFLEIFYLGIGFIHLLLCFVLQFLDNKRRPLHGGKASGDNTLISNVNADSSPLSPTAGTQERNSKQVKARLRLIEQVNILQDDTAGKHLTVSM